MRRFLCWLNGSHNRGAVRVGLSRIVTGGERVYVMRCETCGTWSTKRG